MPEIYLSPSTQEYNNYVTEGTEEEWMNRLTDAMEPYLLASGIRFNRNTPDMTAATSIQASNAGQYDLHLALHSNASGAPQAGLNRGILAFYFPGSGQGLRAAQLLVNALKEIYPLPNLVRTQPTTTLGEIRLVRAAAVLLELGFHDNYEDAVWITTHIQQMARTIVLALTEYFDIPFFEEGTPMPGVVQVEGGTVNVYERPDFQSPAIAQLVSGAMVTILNEFNGWYLVQFGDETGYASADFISVE